MRSDSLPLHSKTPLAWGQAALSDPIALLVDHAFLERKAAGNAMELLTRWPGEWTPGWVELMTSIARDEAAHLAQVVRMLVKRGGQMVRFHACPYAAQLRALVRKGVQGELVDRLLVSALIEARSCERFSVLAEAASADEELAKFYKALYASEMGHYKVFLKLAVKVAGRRDAACRWEQLLGEEARILAAQEPGPRIHSGWQEIRPAG